MRYYTFVIILMAIATITEVVNILKGDKRSGVGVPYAITVIFCAVVGVGLWAMR